MLRGTRLVHISAPGRFPAIVMTSGCPASLLSVKRIYGGLFLMGN